MAKKKKPPNQIEESLIVSKKNCLSNILNAIDPILDFDGSFREILIDKINDVNKEVIHVYLFFTLLFLYLSETNKIFPKINIQFIRDIINVLTYKNEARGRKPKDDKQIQMLK